MAGLKSAASVFAVALYVAFLASPATSQTPSSTARVRGAPGPVAGVGLVGVLVAGGVTYLIGRRRKTDRE